jgi:hypothetical protein
MDNGMSTMEIDVYEAFTSVGINSEGAKKVAAALSESRGGDLARLEKKVDKLDDKLLQTGTSIARLETSVSRHDWMLTFLIAMCLLISGKLFV